VCVLATEQPLLPALLLHSLQTAPGWHWLLLLLICTQRCYNGRHTLAWQATWCHMLLRLLLLLSHQLQQSLMVLLQQQRSGRQLLVCILLLLLLLSLLLVAVLARLQQLLQLRSVLLQQPAQPCWLMSCLRCCCSFCLLNRAASQVLQHV
jgi:hypothetical protein